MPDTFGDPLDHQRSSRPRVGQTLKNPAKIPGVFLVGIGVVAVAFCVISFARQHLGLAILAVVIAVGATGAGLGWLAREAKRLRELERQHDNP